MYLHVYCSLIWATIFHNYLTISLTFYLSNKYNGTHKLDLPNVFLYIEPHLMCLLKQFHSLLKDLTVIFSAFSQHLPSQFLYSSSKFFLLFFTQQLSKLYHCFLLQSIVKGSLKLLDSLSNSITKKIWKGIQSGQNYLFVSVRILNQ